MEILKGMVREKGFEDKECTYMNTDDGKQFYFIEDFQLSNGNIIACSDLSQGVGNKPRQTLGVITPRGEIVIPFENKMIKPLENNLLLVERNAPITPNVIDALAKKGDPQTTTKYMNDANTIKSQLKSVMAGGENFVFDNPFSEAALYTLEGVNVGGNYFSFISKNGNDYYLSTNVVGSSILKYDSSVNINGGNTSDEGASNNQENMDSQNGNDLGDTNTTMNVEKERQDTTSLPTNSLENENGDTLNQEPLVPNIEIPLQLQQQVEDTPPKEEEVTLPSVDSTGSNQDIVNTPSDNLGQPQEQGNTDEAPKTELNINLPVNDILGQNNQDFATNTDSGVETDIAVTTASDTTDQNNNMVNMEESSISDNQPNENDTSSESDNGNTMNEDMETSSVNQIEENADDQGALSSEKEQSEESITIPAGNTEDVETREGELEEDKVPTDEANVSSEDGENRLANSEEVEDNSEEERDTTPPLPENEEAESSAESENVFENTSEEEENDDDTEEDGGIQVESSLPEDINEEEVEDDNLSTENNMETEEMEEENYEDYQEDEITNPVIIDATNTIRKLLEENRKQREIIDRQDSEIETLASSNSILKENNDSKSKEIISLRNSMAKYRSQNSTLSRENNNLKATNTRQEELIENLKSQNITLKEQVAGITALGNAVKEATTVIETHQEDFSQPSELSYLDTAMGEVVYQKRKST